MKKIGFLVSGGIGDCLTVGGCLHAVETIHNDAQITIFVAARKEIFNVVANLFNQYKCVAIDEQFCTELTEGDENLYLEIKTNYNLDELYLNWPDLLFRHPHSFDYKKYNTHPQKIKQFRFFREIWQPKNKIYVGLSTTTTGYLYPNISVLLKLLAKEIPSHEFIFPLVKKWDNKDIDYGNLENLPSNINIIENPNLIDCLGLMEQSCFGIFTCNGPSHYAYSLGMPRLILDPQFSKIPWISRWKEDNNECIPISTGAVEIAKLVKTLIEQPATTLIPRINVLNGNLRGVDWAKELLYKY